MAVSPRGGGLRRRAVRLLAQPGQGVVFAQKGDNGLAAAVAGNKGVGNASGFPHQGKALGFQRAGEPFGGPELFKARFGMIPDVVGNIGKRLTSRVDGISDKSVVLLHYTPRVHGKLSAVRASVSMATFITCSSKSNFSL